MKIDAIISETDTGEMFTGAIMVCVRTRDGNYFDLLFDCCGEPIPLGSQLADQVSRYYNKSFTNIKNHQNEDHRKVQSIK